MRKLSKNTKNNLFTYALVIGAYILLQLLSGGLPYSVKGMLVPMCAYIIAAISLNLTVGILGELSLGHAGFMSVGAFTGAIACIALESAVPLPWLRLAIAVLIGAVFAGITGLIVGIPALRLKGDYLAIVTLAFGEIIRNLATCLYVGMDANGLHFGFLLNGISDLKMGEGARTIVEGPMGITGISRISTFTFGIVMILITLFIILNLVNSRSGRAIMALRDNRIAAESVGIPVTKYKLMAFVTSAALAGAAGVLFAMNSSTVVAKQFDYNISILILVYVVLGGLGNMWGTIISTVVLYALPEVFRPFSKYRMLVYAIVLILVMLGTNNAAVRSRIGSVVPSAKGLFTRKAKKEAGTNE